MDENIFSCSTSLPCEEQQNRQASSFTHYFIIKHIDSTSKNSFKSTSPFLIAKSLQSVLGEVHSIRKLKSDDLLVEVSAATKSNIFSRSTKIGFFSVSVKAHKTLNFSCGFKSVVDLLHFTNEELLENLKSQNFVDACQITIRRNDQILPTKHIILTFNSPNLPNRIKAAY